MCPSEVAGDASDFEDSLLREVARVPIPMRRPVTGQRLGGADGQRFEIVGELGGGAMGFVFRARDAELQRIVALKFLQPLEEAGGAPPMELLKQEARAIARLDHENIVRLFDVGVWTGQPWEAPVPFLVMECLDGEALGELLRRGRLGPRRALAILDQVAAGLAHAHEQHLVHRDLKPSNVFLTRRGTVKLLDFGLAWLEAREGPAVPRLPTAGTPPYMAPEQWRGEPQDERTDLWAAGVLLYEMLTGQQPFFGEHLDALRGVITSGDSVPSLRRARPELAEAFDPLFAALLAREPSRRLGSAAVLRERLRQVEESLSPWREEPRPLAAGRRQVTLVGCWFAGLAGLAERLEPEDFGEAQAAFHQACSQVIQRHGGSITLLLGDEVIACFGHPRAREDDSERAARAARALPEAIRAELSERLPPAESRLLDVRVGLHTDLVVFDDLPVELRGRTPAIQGEAPKVALWLARQAEPGAVSLSGTTSTLIHSAFRTQPLGARAFEGLAGRRELEVHRLLRERKATSRFGRSHGPGALARFVDRERELGELTRFWARVREGQGGFMLLSGEAGMGKSRLMQELRRHVPATSALRLQCQCWAWFSHSAFQPFIEMLQHLMRLTPGHSPQANLGRLRKHLGRLGLDVEQVALIASFLSLPGDEGRLGLQLSPQRKKEKTFEALTALLLRVASERPVLLTIEDLHWADPSTLELLGHLLGHVGDARIGVVLTARPDFLPGWPGVERLQTVTLERLPAARAAELVRQMAGERALPAELVRRLVETTDGVPLFIEEMTRMVLASAPAGPSAVGPRPFTIPVTLNELLLNRLDLLPPRQKALAQLCAVAGRSFPRELLVALTGGPEVALERDLSDLCDARLLTRQEDLSGPGYAFRHALIQEAAYQSLVRSTRRRYHGRIAQALAARLPSLAESQPEIVAYHYTEAGLVEPAIDYWARAGESASRRSANVEAVSHLQQALAQLGSLPDAAARIQDELKLLLALGVPLFQQEGCSYRVEQTYARAWELIFAMGDALPRLGLSYWGIFSYYFARAKFEQAQRLAAHLVTLGERHRHRELLALGQRMMAVSLFTFGRMNEAAEHIQRALTCARFELARHRAITVRQWISPRAAALAYGAVVYSALGDAEQARRLDADAVQLAEQLGHPNTTALVLTYTAMACQLRREPRPAMEKATRCMALARENQFLIWMVWCSFVRAWALSELGQPAEGLARMQAALSQWRASGMRAGMPFFLGLVAECQLKLERPREALAAVTEALGWAETTGERSYEVELYRLEGECLRALGREHEATELFLRALQVARQQGAGTYERHVEETLAAPLREHGAHDEVWRTL
ncbi:protein kinase [Myxococcaceae bacterium GXIMD 01537]